MPLKPFIRGGGYFASRKWTPLVRYNGLTTSGDDEEEPVDPSIVRTVTGFSPITLIKAIAHSILSLTQYGKVEQRNLPQGYTELDYIESTGTQYIDTGIVVKANTRAKSVFAFTSASNRRLFGKIAGASNTALNYREVGTTFYWFGAITSPSATDTDKHTVEFAADGKVYKDGIEIGTRSTFGSGTALPIYLFAELSDSSAINYGAVKVYSFTLYEDSTPVFNAIPAKRNSDNVLGMYDTVSGSFFTNAGTGSFTAGSVAVPSPTAPMDLWCNNGVLRYGEPLTPDPTRYYAYISTSSTWSYSADSYSIVIPVTVGKKYKITADPTTPIDGGVVNIILRWGFVDTVYDNWKQSAVVPSSTSVTIYDWVRSTPQDTQSVEVTATHPFMVIQMGAAAFASNLANGRIGVGVQEIYADGTPETLTITADGAETQTVNDVPMLLGVGDYKDAAEIISGIKTGKVGAYALTGNETVTAGTDGSGNTRFIVTIPGALNASGRTVCLSTHYQYAGSGNIQNSIFLNNGKAVITVEGYTTEQIADFKADVAAEYANGTPVIVVYPLITETTEQGTAHALTTAEGTNMISAVTNVDPVALTCEYKGVADGE